MAESTSDRIAVQDLPDKPFQPSHFQFPARSFGVTAPVKRSFQSSWFRRFEWIHYDAVLDAVFCFSCCKAAKQGKVKVTGVTERSFIIKGFTNWKDAIRIFVKHESCCFHKQAVMALSNHADVGEMLSVQHAKEKKLNREYLLKVLSTIRYLARQGIPLRGDGNEKDSNFYQLLVLRGEDISCIKPMLEKSQLKYTSPEIQNEILTIMANQILRKIAAQLQLSFFTVMIDETTDIANTEQVVLVFRWVDNTLSVHEEFVGLYKTESIHATYLVKIIQDTLLRFNLKFELCRGQCYDGASVMRGIKTGVAKCISDKEPRAVFTHCYGHALNLAVGDTVKQSKVMKSSLETVYEISKLVKKSPKRDAMFQKLKQELAPDTPGVRILCPTRWTVRAASLQSVLDNYEALLALWEEAKESPLDSETKARIIGVEAQMASFNFLFGVSLGALILNHSDNLSRTLQHQSMSAAEGQHMARLTLDVLKSLRQPEQFYLFYQRVLHDQQRFDISIPSLPRKRRAPRQLETGSTEGDYHSSTEEYYRMLYYEAIDLVIEAITERFDQPGYKIYRNLEDLILNTCRGQRNEEELDFVCNFYKDDLDKQQLRAQLPLLFALFNDVQKSEKREITIHNVLKILCQLSSPQQLAFSQVFIVMKLLLVMPATNSCSERSFSALRRLKTHLRSTMSQLRLNNLLVLHIHKNETDAMNLADIGNEFVASKDLRLRMFGKF